MQETLPPGMDRANQNNTGPFFQINLCERERLQPVFSDFPKCHEEFKSDLCSPFSDFSINAFGNSALSVQPAAQRVLSHIQFPLRLHPGPLMAAHIIRQRKPSLLLRPPQIKWLKVLRSKNKKVATIRTLWGSADRGFFALTKVLLFLFLLFFFLLFLFVDVQNRFNRLLGN